MLLMISVISCGKTVFFQIEHFHNFFFIILAFLRLVRNHENNVGRYRTPERLALQRHDIQRLFECDIGQLHRNAP